MHCQQRTLKYSPGSSRAPSSPIPLGVLPSLPLGNGSEAALALQELSDFTDVCKLNFIPGKEKNVTLSKQMGYCFMFLRGVSVALAHSLQKQYFQYLRGKISKKPGTIMFCTCLGKAFKGSPTNKQIQTTPVTRGQTLQGINYNYGAKQKK